MADKLIYDKDFKAPDGTEFNDMPQGWREVNWAEYSRALLLHPPQYRETRQILRNTDGERLERVIFAILEHHSDGTGRAIDTSSKTAPKFFLFGCDHDFEEKKIGNCLYRLTCKRCGHSKTVDSSD